MKKFIVIFSLLVLALQACKKGNSEFVIEGIVTDQTFSQPLENAQIVLSKITNGEKVYFSSTHTDAQGKYSIKVKRDRFETLEISVNKTNYFEVSQSVVFDNLSVKNKNEFNLDVTGKSWAKVHLVHSGDNTAKLDVVKSIGKSYCEECCPEGYHQFVGNIDTTYYCINDANTLYEITYFKQFSSFNGKKSVVTPFMDTIELYLSY